MPKRYTAIVKVVEVETTSNPNVSRGGKAEEIKIDRELSSFTVRAGSLENLKKNLSAHVELIEEIN